MNMTLTIVVKDGQLRMDGPVDNTIACLGVLDLAKAAVRDHARQQHSKIQPATMDPAMLSELLKRGQ